MIYMKLAIPVGHGRHSKRGNHRGKNGAVCIHHGSLLRQSRQTSTGHKTWPEYPQKQCSKEGEGIGCLGGGHDAWVNVDGVQSSAGAHTKESGKHVEVNSITNIIRIVKFPTNKFIHCVQNHLKMQIGWISAVDDLLQYMYTIFILFQNECINKAIVVQCPSVC